jgi:hypothetical protein
VASLVGSVAVCALQLGARVQTAPARPDHVRSGAKDAGSATARVYEDDEIRVAIPTGWKVSAGDHPAVGPYTVNGRIAAGSSVTQAKGKLLLEEHGYTLALAFDTGYASPVGRFIEMLRIPWLNPDEAWTCSGQFIRTPQPVSRTLMLINLILDTGISKVRENCGIEKDVGNWTGEGTKRGFVGERRWFAGYFTTSDMGYFFQSAGDSCGEKTYTLTSDAETPNELPPFDDPNLKRVTTEAIDIVNSIHYKRCPPVTNP